MGRFLEKYNLPKHESGENRKYEQISHKYWNENVVRYILGRAYLEQHQDKLKMGICFLSHSNVAYPLL